MQFLKHLQSKLSHGLRIRSLSEPNPDRDLITNRSSISVISPNHFSSHDVSLILSSSSALSSVSAHCEISKREETTKTANASAESYATEFANAPIAAATSPDDEIKSYAFTNSTNIISRDNSNNRNGNNSGVHSSINSDGEISPAFKTLSFADNFFRHNSRKESFQEVSPSLCQTEPVILSLTPLSKSAHRKLRTRDGGGGGGITTLSHSSRRISSAPHDTSFNANLSKRPDTGLNSLQSRWDNNATKGNLEDKGDEFLKDASINIISNCRRERGAAENPWGINNNIRTFPSSSDYCDSHQLKEKSLPFQLVNDDDPLIQLVGKEEKEELPVRKKEIEKGTKDKKDGRIRDDYNSAADTDNTIRESKNNIFSASGASSKVSSSSSITFTEGTTPITSSASAEKKEQHQQLSSFLGSSEVDGQQRDPRRASIPSTIYGTAAALRIWDKPANDNRTRKIRSSIERREGYEGKLVSVDSNGTKAGFKSGDKEKERKVGEGKALSHSKDIAKKFPSLDPNPILSYPPVEAEPDPVARINVEERREQSCLTDALGGTTRDQSWPNCSSRNTTFTRDRPSSSSSLSSIFSDSDSNSLTWSCNSPSAESELGSIVIVASEEGENSSSAPVVVASSIQTTNSLSPRYITVGDSASEGFSCSHKVNQRKKSNPARSHNGNVNSKNSNNHNSEISPEGQRERGKAKYSVIQCLLCTNGSNLLDSRKKLFARIFHCCGGKGGSSLSKQREPQQKRNKLKETSRRIQPSLSFSSSSSSSVLPSSRNKPKSRRKGRKSRLVRRSRHFRGDDRPLTKAQLRLWATMDHEDLIRELPTIEKLSNQERLRLAHKRRMLQLKKFQQYEKDLNSNSKKHRGDSDLIRRNLPGKHNHHAQGGRKGSRRIRFRNSIMLLEAAGRNDVEEVRLLLESGVNPDVANEDGLTALHQCCIDDNEEMMKLLLDYGANVNAEDSERWTPLHAAATCGHLHLVQYLIVRSANLLSVNAEGNMPYDICDDETTLDYIESEMAKRGVTQELIEEIRALPETRMLQEMQRVHAQGGDLECRDVDGATPLHIASANGYYRVAEFLLDNHTATDVQDKDFWQPIHAAACWGHLDVLELLVQNGADLDARTKNNETPYAICEDPEIKERIIQLRTEQQTKRQNEGRKRPSRTHSTNSRTQSIRRTSQRDKGLTSKRDAADEAQMLRAREEVHKENSPSPTSDATGGNGSGKNNTTSVAINGNPVNGVALPLNGDTQNNIIQNGNGSSEEDPEERSFPAALLGRDSIGNMKMKADDANRLREIAVKSGAVTQNNHLNNQHVIHNGNPNGGVKMNNLLHNESNGSLMKNQNNIHKNLNTSSNGTGVNGPVTVLSSPDDNGNLLPKPEINPSVDNKVPLGGGLGSGVSLSGSRDNLVGLSNSAGNSTIDIHVSVTINTNSPVSTLTNGGGSGGTGSHGLNGSIPMSPGNSIFTPPGTLSDLKKQRSLIRTSSNPLTNGGMNDSMTKYHPPASPTMSLRRYVGDPAETVGDYGDGGKRCCVIV